jgi:riboflavin kinase/FMN adenylyltransferase
VNILAGPLAGWTPQTGDNAVTIGVFDGVHIGHRSIIEQLESSGDPATVLTFDPHPAEVLSPGRHPRLITTIEERAELLERAGVDTMGVLDLNEIRHFEPDRFVGDVLVGKLGVDCLVVGSDFHFGKDRSGDVAYLRRAGEQLGFDVVAADLVESGGDVVSSTRIRAAIEAGEVGAAAAMLGSRFQLSNEVLHGEKRGRDLGFPTANLRPPERKVIPGRGIYAVFARFEGERLPAAVSVGVRPTFGGGELLIEAFVLDFEGDLYGKTMTIEFVERLRPELEFENVGALIARMSDDVEDVRRILDAAVAG